MEHRNQQQDQNLVWSSAADVGDWLRNKRRYPQKALASIAGVDQSTIARIEQGKRPRNLETAGKIAGADKLSERETAALMRSWFGVSPHSVEMIRDLLAACHRAMHIDICPSKYAYFAPLYHRPDFMRVDQLWELLEEILPWLLDQPPDSLIDYLLVDFGATLPHYLDNRVEYLLRGRLCSRAVEAAKRLERFDIAGWLLCDGLSWLYLEQHYNLKSARSCLEEGIAVAERIGDASMKALGTAYRARLHLREQNLRGAESDLRCALRWLDSAPDGLQKETIRTRIAWVERDIIAERLERRESKALDLTVVPPNPIGQPTTDAVFSKLKDVHVLLIAGEHDRAWTILRQIEEEDLSHLSRYDHAYIAYEFARHALHCGKQREAQDYAARARNIVQSLSVKPYFTRDVRVFSFA